MKKLIGLVLLMLLTYSINAQKITWDPLFKLGYYAGGVHSWAENGGDIMRHDPQHAIEYNTVIGLRLNYKEFHVETKHQMFLLTDNFLDSDPYAYNMYFNTYWQRGNFKIGYEHAAIHPINIDIGESFNTYGGYDEFSVSYNL